MVKNKKELKGIHGWLIVVLVAFGISILFSALNALLFFLNFIQGNLYYLPLALTYSLLVFVFTYSLISMINKKRKSKKLAILSLWFGFLIYMILFLISILNNSAVTNRSYFIAGFNLVFSLILTLYFVNSKRIKNTFTK
jgi:hypothetical protein